MKLACYFTLWGWKGSAQDAVIYAHSQGFDGIEGPCPAGEKEKHLFADALSNCGMKYIQEIATTGTYVPDRSLSLDDHINYFEQALRSANILDSQFITCLGGCDAWDLSDSIVFFQETRAIATGLGKDLCFETHRGRSLFNPWICKRICEAMPDIKLTLDLSHWNVVCEGLQESEFDLLCSIIKHIHHIHARVGYDQGPQVPHPKKGVYVNNFLQHLDVWRRAWHAQSLKSREVSSITPEFGVDGYEYRSVDGKIALVDPTQINIEMMNNIRQEFEILNKEGSIPLVPRKANWSVGT